jgi:DNA-binding MurR/RpiR family transcriptional regulator
MTQHAQSCTSSKETLDMNRQPPAPGDLTVADRIRQIAHDMTPAEQKIARILFASAMVAGLETVASLAERANVSGPSVIRLTTKLGFDSYIDFQRTLRDEMEERSNSPLSLYARSSGKQPGDQLAKSRDVFTAAMRQSFDRISPAEFNNVVETFCDLKRSIYLAGGRFTQLIAQMLYLHLYQMRPGIRMIQDGLQRREDQLLDLGPKSVLTIFDFRRYQSDSVSLARAAHERGARTILVTDPWESPIAEFADHVLIAEVTSPSPYDSMVPAFALVEALIAEIMTKLNRDAVKRIEDLEVLRTGFEWNGKEALDQQQRRKTKRKKQE